MSRRPCPFRVSGYLSGAGEASGRRRRPLVGWRRRRPVGWVAQSGLRGGAFSLSLDVVEAVEDGAVDLPVDAALLLEDVLGDDDGLPAEGEGDEFDDADDLAGEEAPDAESDALGESGEVALLLGHAEDVEGDFEGAADDVADGASELVGGSAEGVGVELGVILGGVESDDAGEEVADFAGADGDVGADDAGVRLGADVPAAAREDVDVLSLDGALPDGGVVLGAEGAEDGGQVAVGGVEVEDGGLVVVVDEPERRDAVREVDALLVGDGGGAEGEVVGEGDFGADADAAGEAAADDVEEVADAVPDVELGRLKLKLLSYSTVAMALSSVWDVWSGVVSWTPKPTGPWSMMVTCAVRVPSERAARRARQRTIFQRVEVI